MYCFCHVVLYYMWYVICIFIIFFFFKQKTAYEMRISDWSSDVCSSDLAACLLPTATSRVPPAPEDHAMSRFGYVMTTYVAVMLMVILSVVSFAPNLICNASASTPIGLYEIGASGPIEVTDLVAVRSLDPLPAFHSDGGTFLAGLPRTS